MSKGILDVAVVGGGVSGVYTAWRLLTEGKAKDIQVFEAGDHIGGRLLSVAPPDIPNMMAELGGMRILPDVQPLVAKLVETLNLETYPFPVDQDQNIAYLRGVYLRLYDFTKRPAKAPYHLTFQEFGQTATSILVNGFEQIVPGITNKKLTEEQRRKMAQNAEFAGEKLYKQGFWNVLARVISGEAYQFGVDAGGYESTLSNWNAADAIPWFLTDFVDSKYEGFTKGFQEVPLTVAGMFEKAGGKIHLNNPLEGFVWEGENAAGRFKLKFKDGSPVEARNLVLAMPRRSLELLSPHSPLLSNTSAGELIKSVTPRPLFKLFTTYNSPWWRAAGANIGGKYFPLEKGRTTTDLPVRQTYYWTYGDGEPVVDGPGMLMASYDDGVNIGFWDGLRWKRGKGWRTETEHAQSGVKPFLGKADREAERKHDPSTAKWREYHAPEPMVHEVERQLMTIHGLSFTPDVVNAAYKDWGDDPFGGGWNSWNIGVQSQEVKKKIIQPYEDEKIPLFICGEAYSDAQGWVEGALQTADMVLGKFGLPAFVPPAKASRK